MSLLVLSSEIVQAIGLYLSVDDVHSLSISCKNIHRVLWGDSYFWHVKTCSLNGSPIKSITGDFGTRSNAFLKHIKFLSSKNVVCRSSIFHGIVTYAHYGYAAGLSLDDKLIDTALTLGVNGSILCGIAASGDTKAFGEYRDRIHIELKYNSSTDDFHFAVEHVFSNSVNVFIGAEACSMSKSKERYNDSDKSEQKCCFTRKQIVNRLTDEFSVDGIFYQAVAAAKAGQVHMFEFGNIDDEFNIYWKQDHFVCTGPRRWFFDSLCEHGDVDKFLEAVETIGCPNSECLEECALRLGFKDLYEVTDSAFGRITNKILYSVGLFGDYNTILEFIVNTDDHCKYDRKFTEYQHVISGLIDGKHYDILGKLMGEKFRDISILKVLVNKGASIKIVEDFLVGKFGKVPKNVYTSKTGLPRVILDSSIGSFFDIPDRACFDLARHYGVKLNSRAVLNAVKNGFHNELKDILDSVKNIPLSWFKEGFYASMRNDFVNDEAINILLSYDPPGRALNHGLTKAIISHKLTWATLFIELGANDVDNIKVTNKAMKIMTGKTFKKSNECIGWIIENY